MFEGEMGQSKRLILSMPATYHTIRVVDWIVAQAIDYNIGTINQRKQDCWIDLHPYCLQKVFWLDLMGEWDL